MHQCVRCCTLQHPECELERTSKGIPAAVHLGEQAVLQQERHDVQRSELRARLLQQRLGVHLDDVLHRVQAAGAWCSTRSMCGNCITQHCSLAC